MQNGVTRNVNPTTRERRWIGEAYEQRLARVKTVKDALRLAVDFHLGVEGLKQVFEVRRKTCGLPGIRLRASTEGTGKPRSSTQVSRAGSSPRHTESKQQKRKSCRRQISGAPSRTRGTKKLRTARKTRAKSVRGVRVRMQRAISKVRCVGKK